MKSASSIVRSACLASSDCDEGASSSTVTLEGTEINTVYGYPSAEEAGIGEAAQINTDDYTLDGDWGASSAGNSVTLTIDGNTTCAATFATATDNGGELGDSASVTTDTSGC